MLYWISATSLAMSVVAFVLFVRAILTAGNRSGTTLGDVRQEAALDSLAKLAEAVAKLVDSLTKSGPSVVTLMAAIVFIVISLIAAR